MHLTLTDCAPGTRSSSDMRDCPIGMLIVHSAIVVVAPVGYLQEFRSSSGIITSLFYHIVLEVYLELQRLPASVKRFFFAKRVSFDAFECLSLYSNITL